MADTVTTMKLWRSAETTSCFAAANGVGLVPYMVLPYLTAIQMGSFGLTAAQAGKLSSSELGALSFAALLLVCFIHRVSLRLIAGIGVMIAISGNILTALFADSYETILICRIIAGIGCGFALAAGNAVLSKSSNPEEVYSRVAVYTAVLLTIYFVVIPMVVRSFGHAGFFLLIALQMTLTTPLLLRLPTSKAANARSEPICLPMKPSNMRSWAGTGIFIASFIFLLRDTVAWAFAERVGTGLGLSAETLGTVFATNALVSISGGIFAALIGLRWGWTVAVGFGVTATGLATVAIVQTQSVAVYSGLVVVWSGLMLFTMSYVMGLAARLDTTGRLPAAVGGAMQMGIAAGPFVGGAIIERWGQQGLGWVMLAMVAASGFLAILSARQADRYSRDEKTTPYDERLAGKFS